MKLIDQALDCSALLPARVHAVGDVGDDDGERCSNQGDYHIWPERIPHVVTIARARSTRSYYLMSSHHCCILFRNNFPVDPS